MTHVLVDPDSTVASEHFAIVRASRRKRGRYPEACVRIVKSESEARKEADAGRNEHAARVYGPSRSSEGLRLYYLVSWLD